MSSFRDSSSEYEFRAVPDGSDVGPRTVEPPHVMLVGARPERNVSQGLGRFRPGGDVDATLWKALGKLARPAVKAVLARVNNLLSGDVAKLCVGSPSGSRGVVGGGVSPHE